MHPLHVIFASFRYAAVLVAVSAAILTIRSYSREDTSSYGWTTQDELVLCVLKGRLGILWRSDSRGVDGGWRFASRRADSYRLEEEFERTCCGFALEKGWYSYRDRGGVDVRKALLPLHALTGLLLVGVALFGGGLGRAMKRRCQLASHMCIACGYDLTGNTSGICPECGTAIEHSVAEKP